MLLLPKKFLLATGWIERDLMWVTTSKIGALPGSYFSPPILLARLKLYQLFFRGTILSSRDSNTLARIDAAILDLSTDCANGSLRKQPFCVVLYGKPGVGKSSYAIQIAQHLMKARHGGFNSTDMVTLNETDEYQSEFRTSHKVVLFDDIGAAPMDCNDTKNPWRKVIDFVNNIRKTALNPNCEMKGKVYIEPELVILTTNLNIPHASHCIGRYVLAPEAIYRRFNLIIEVIDYTTSSLKKMSTGELISGPAMSSQMRADSNSSTAITKTSDTMLRSDTLNVLLKEFSDHMEMQEEFVSCFNQHFDDLRISLVPQCGPSTDFPCPGRLVAECATFDPNEEVPPFDTDNDSNFTVSYPLLPVESEVTQIRRLVDNSILKSITNIYYNYSLGISPYLGEIDLMVLDEGCILLMEAKRTIGQHWKATQQVTKYCRAMTILCPTWRVYGVTMNYSAIQLAYDNETTPLVPSSVLDDFVKTIKRHPAIS